MTSGLDSDLLRTFVAVADCGSVSGAAPRLARTQSAVSVQLRKLEELAGRALFLRHARGVRPTPAGEALLGRARRVLRALDEAEASLTGDPLTGKIRIGVPEEFGAPVLPDVLARFAETHPDVEVTVACEPSSMLEQGLMAGALDLAVLVIDSGRLNGELLVHDPTVWVTSTRNEAHMADPLPVAVYDQDCWWRDWALRTLDDRGQRYRIAYASHSVAGVQAAVASGLAVGVLARSTMPPDTRALGEAEGYTELPGSAIVLRQRDRASSRAVAAMAEAVRSAFRQAR